MKIVITESQLKSIIEVSGKLKYPDLDLLSKDELEQIARNHFKKYRTLVNNKRLLNACIDRGIDIDSFRKVTDAKKYRGMSDDELLKLARTYGDYSELQRKAGVLYYELKGRGLSKKIFSPFMRHINTEIPNDKFVKKHKEHSDLDDDRRYPEDSFMFSPVNEQMVSNIINKIKSYFGDDKPKAPSVKPFSLENLKDEIVNQGIKFPNIALAQAVLESGHFDSDIFKENNNLFGMKKPSVRKTTATGENRGHATYKNWVDSVKDYKLFQDELGYSNLNLSGYMQKLDTNYCPGCNYTKKIKDQLDYNKKNNIFI